MIYEIYTAAQCYIYWRGAREAYAEANKYVDIMGTVLFYANQVFLTRNEYIPPDNVIKGFVMLENNNIDISQCRTKEKLNINQFSQEESVYQSADPLMSENKDPLES